MRGEDWTDLQNDQIVADYFSMLIEELSGRTFNKAAHNRALQALTGRDRGSIEFKHANISHVMQALGLPTIVGYKPRSKAQYAALSAAIDRWLQHHPDWWAQGLERSRGFADDEELYIGVAPTFRNQEPSKDQAELDLIARKFDVAGRDARNRALGKAGEELAYHHERKTLGRQGLDHLARRVRWVSEEDGDGLGYDILSFFPNGKERLIEVKTTTGWERTPFFLTRNELEVSQERKDAWCLYRLYDFARKPQAFEIRPPLEAHVSLLATSYEARFS